jgi:hypothetical protein
MEHLRAYHVRVYIGGVSLMWLICPTRSMICLPYYLKFLTLFVVFVGS